MKTVCILLLMFTFCVNAQDQKSSYIGFTFENDSFLKEDGLYSNGLIFSWGYNELSTTNLPEISEERGIPQWLGKLLTYTYISPSATTHYAISNQIGQLIQTSVDLKETALVKQDAPYVGLFAWQGRLTHYDHKMSDELALTIGIVGAASGGEFVQDTVHKVIDATVPQGWSNQIDNELVIALEVKRIYSGWHSTYQSSEFDIVYGAKAALGNLRSDLETGAVLRWGKQLQKTVYSAPVFPIRKFNTANKSALGWYLFANISGAYVFNDIFMDGNTFEHSHQVSLINEQLAGGVGLNLSYHHFNLVYSLVHISDQYQGQREASRFGSVRLSYHF